MAASSTEMLVNSDGLVVNAYHNAEGRGNYFPGSAGTSEGQFLFIIGNIRAYKATGNLIAKEMAELALKNLLRVVYRNMPVPDLVDRTHIFAPHWLFNVKYPFDSSIIYYDRTVNFVGGVGYIADTRTRYVYGARSLDSVLLWDNPYSPLTAGAAYNVASSVAVVGMGIKVTLTTGYTGTLFVTHSIQAGEAIQVSEPFEAWPDWRKLEPGEIACAADVFVWAHRAFTLAAEVFPNPTWSMAARATREQAAIAFDINDSRDWVKRSWAKSAFAIGSRFSYSTRVPAPIYATDANGNVVVTVPTYGAGGKEVQYGNASVLDVYGTNDVTAVEIGSSTPVTVTLYIDPAQSYSAAQRYSAQVALAGSGLQTVQLSRASFKNPAGQTIPANMPVYTFGVQTSADLMHTVTIGRVRQTPPRDVAYYPGAIPFTANFQGNPAQLIDWRGPIYMGYQSPYMWLVIGNKAAAVTDVALLSDAQQQWKVQTGIAKLGPFAPVFIFDRSDAVQYGTANTFGWEGPDPNTRWGGYQYRPLPELIEAAANLPVGDAMRTEAIRVAQNFLKWLAQDLTWLPMWAPWSNKFAEGIENSLALAWYTMPVVPIGAEAFSAAINKASAHAYLPTDTEVPMLPYWDPYSYPILPPLEFPLPRAPFGPPTDFPRGAAETNYPEPHMTALIMRSVIELDAILRPAGNTTGVMQIEHRALMSKCMALLEAMWIEEGVMAGTFSNNSAAHEWYGFWHGEILDTLSQVYLWASRPDIARPSVAAQAKYWIDGMLRFSKSSVLPATGAFQITPWRYTPNWSGRIVEDFEYSTSVFESFSGKEQRISVRPEPRRKLTLRHLLQKKDAQGYDALLRARQNLPMLVPQWQMAVAVTEDALVDQDYLLVASTDLTAFTWGQNLALSRDGGAIVLVKVASTEGNRINLISGLSASVKLGDRVMPACNGLIDQDLSATRYTGTVLDSQTSFRMLPQEDIRELPVSPAAMRFLVGTDNREVITRKPNWSKELSVGQAWSFNTSEDFSSGPIVPINGRSQGARTIQALWSLKTKAEITDHLGLVQRLRGRRYACWLPSWTDDFVLTRDVTSQTQLFVQTNAFIDLGTTDDPAVAVFVRFRDGRSFAARVASHLEVGSDETRLTLDRALGATATMSQVEMISLLYRVRQVSDTSTISWLSDSVAETAAAFVSVYGDI
jgi:hypothetical protein